jgi:hypothetical protein
MTIDTSPHHSGPLAYFAKCPTCLFVSEPYGDEASARVLGSIHRCD